MFTSNIKLQMPRFLGICFIVMSMIFGFAACEPEQPIEDVCEVCGQEPCVCEDEVCDVCGENPCVCQPVDSTEYTIKFSAKAEYEIPSEASSKTVVFTCDGPWTLYIPEDAQSWVSAEVMSGEGSTKRQSLKINFAANEGAQRKATLEIRAGISVGKIKITQQQVTIVLTEAEVEDFERYYKPKEFGFDMLRSDSKWSFCRSKQSEHFIVFWDLKYGEYGLYGEKMGVENTSPATLSKSHSMYVDIDDLLVKAEQFFDTNVNKLKMAELGVGKSYLDDYKMEIYIIWQSEWLATGSGYDNVIGALWVNPSTCKPVGSTIAHEIGHSFQYQTYCDKVYQGEPNNLQYGFRYGFGPKGEGGCAYWEQCAQWQSFQDYPSQQFGGDLNVFRAQYNRHYHHEWMRYASYWLQSYWVEKRGVEAYGALWRESVLPEDAIKTYTKLYNGGDWSKTAAEIYDYAARMATFDIDGVREYAGAYQKGVFKTTLYKVDGGYYQVSYGSCPSTTGFNIISLNLPDQPGATVTAHFKGLPVGSSIPEADNGNYVDGDLKTQTSKSRSYNNVAKGMEGWRYGFVALNKDGSRVYSDMYSDKEGDATFTVPADAEALFFVVLGAPEEYRQNEWDDDASDDDQWPYMVKFTDTDLLGNFSIDEDADPKDIALSFDVNCDASNGSYPLGTIDLSSNKSLAQAFAMTPSNITSLIQAVGTTPAEGKIVWALEQTDGSYAYKGTANNGFWCTSEGNVVGWGADAYVYAEFDGLTITYGHYPGHTAAGTTYTIKPTLIYTKGGNQYKATIEVNMAY